MAPWPAAAEQAIEALQRAGLLRPISGDLMDRYACLAPGQREAVRQQLAERRFDPPLSEQIIEDRGKA